MWRALLNITYDRKGISKFVHVILLSFMITTRIYVDHSLKKIWLLNLELTEVQAGQIFGNFLGKEKLTHFFPMQSFFTPWKYQKNRKVFWCFQGVEKGCIGNEWVN